MSDPPSDSSGDADLQRVIVTLPKAAIKFLKAEADRTGSSMGEIVRQAIANTQYLQSETKRGANVLLSEEGKPTTRLVIR